MEPWHWAILLKPFFLFLMFIPGAILVWWLRRYLPDSRLKRILFFSWKV